MRRATLNGGMLAATAAGLLIGTAALAQQPDRNRGGADIRGRTNLNLDNRGNRQGARIDSRVNAGNRARGNLGAGVRTRGNRFDAGVRQQRGYRGNRGNWRGNRGNWGGRNGVGVGVFLGGGQRSFYGNRGYNGYYSNRTYYPNNAYQGGNYGGNYRSYGGGYHTGSGHTGYSSGPCASGVQHQGYVQGGHSQGYQESGERHTVARPDFGGRTPAQRAGFGVSFDDTADGVVRIAHVYPNSPAARAGIQAGDILVGLNGQQIRDDWQGTVSQIRGMSPGDELDLMVQRDGQEQELNAELATWDEAFADRDRQPREEDAPPASDADLNNADPADETAPADPRDRANPPTPDEPGSNNEAGTPDRPNLNDEAEEAETDIDAETPDTPTTPRNPNLPELPQGDTPESAADAPESADTPESAAETTDQPKQE